MSDEVNGEQTKYAWSDNGDASIFAQTNVAIWVLTMSSGLFLAIRLWCRNRFSKLWWDDGLLTLSWVRCCEAGYWDGTDWAGWGWGLEAWHGEPGANLPCRNRSSCCPRPR
jgi:hypothetical protein